MAPCQKLETQIFKAYRTRVSQSMLVHCEGVVHSVFPPTAVPQAACQYCFWCRGARVKARASKRPVDQHCAYTAPYVGSAKSFRLDPKLIQISVLGPAHALQCALLHSHYIICFPV